MNDELYSKSMINNEKQTSLAKPVNQLCFFFQLDICSMYMNRSWLDHCIDIIFLFLTENDKDSLIIPSTNKDTKVNFERLLSTTLFSIKSVKHLIILNQRSMYKRVFIELDLLVQLLLIRVSYSRLNADEFSFIF
ncbi:unnamed protein product [Rotaria sordida]|uniref:Uncharacterized protein n=1 Tax=Rotaria sordida TaxID=392033 RepID=A0A814YER4_9BILA|nr:unnamed protein product [Rotaria sordida]CAF1510243.1 unnamed protein product [Rotaria sordida]